MQKRAAPVINLILYYYPCTYVPPTVRRHVLGCTRLQVRAGERSERNGLPTQVDRTERACLTDVACPLHTWRVRALLELAARASHPSTSCFSSCMRAQVCYRKRGMQNCLSSSSSSLLCGSVPCRGRLMAAVSILDYCYFTDVCVFRSVA
jgi:hypothetical protein